MGVQAFPKIKNDTLNVFVKPLANGDFAITILNRSDVTQSFNIDFKDAGLIAKYEIKDLWQHKTIGNGVNPIAIGWKGDVKSHETKLFRLKQN